jgi:hypothetical protein
VLLHNDTPSPHSTQTNAFISVNPGNRLTAPKCGQIFIGDSIRNLHLRKHELKFSLRHSPNNGRTFVAENHGDVSTFYTHDTTATFGISEIHMRNRGQNFVAHVSIVTDRRKDHDDW